MTEVKGYCVLTQTISSWELVWRTGEGDETLPQVFETERAAQLEILDDLQSDIEQFKAEEREWDEIHWPENEYRVCKIDIDENGHMIVWDGPEMYMCRVITTELADWRASL